jgi:hypothetical protein
MWHRSVARHDLCLQHCRISRLAWDEDPLQGGRQTFCTAFAGVPGITSEWWPASVRTAAGIKSESRPASQIWEKYEAEESNDGECDVAVSIGGVEILSPRSLGSTPLIFEWAVVLLIPLHCRDGVDISRSFRPVERNLRHVDDGFLAA